MLLVAPRTARLAAPDADRRDHGRVAAVGDRAADSRSCWRSASARGTAILVVEQNVPFAFAVADRYAVLKLGEIADDGVAGDGLAAARVQDQLRV